MISREHADQALETRIELAYQRLVRAEPPRQSFCWRRLRALVIRRSAAQIERMEAQRALR